jgi:hypothetical protein
MNLPHTAALAIVLTVLMLVILAVTYLLTERVKMT